MNKGVLKTERHPNKINTRFLQYEYTLYFSCQWPNEIDWLVYAHIKKERLASVTWWEREGWHKNIN